MAHGDANVVTLLVTLTLKPEHEQDFLEVAAGMTEQVLREESGALLYALHAHPDTPSTYVWVERYADEDAFQAHMEAPYVTEGLAKLADWFAQPPEMVKLGQVLPG